MKTAGGGRDSVMDHNGVSNAIDYRVQNQLPTQGTNVLISVFHEL